MTSPDSYVSYVRRHVGSRRILLAYVTVILHDAQDRVLLHHRRDFDRWGLPGGVLELGEDLRQAARRELQEETGLQVGELALVGVYSEPELGFTYPNGDQVQQFTVCVAGPLAGGRMQADGVEASQQAFFSPGEIPWELLTPWYRRMLREYCGGGFPLCPPPVSLREVEPQIQVMRAALGAQPLIAPGSVAAVTNESGRLLLVQRREDSLWTLPGGFCEIGENISHCAQRELQEETGLLAAPERLLGVFAPGQLYTYPNGDQVQPCITALQMRLVGGELHQHSAETTRAAWLAPEQIRALELPGLIKTLHTAVLDHLPGDSFLRP